MRVWTFAYHAFILGGDVNSIICTDVDEVFNVTLRQKGKLSITLCQVATTDDRLFWVEASSGGLYGQDLDVAISDYLRADATVLDNQLRSMHLQGKHATEYPPEQFWSLVTPHKSTRSTDPKFPPLTLHIEEAILKLLNKAEKFREHDGDLDDACVAMIEALEGKM